MRRRRIHLDVYQDVLTTALAIPVFVGIKTKAFDITYTDADGAVRHAWTTSWGSSTRMIGGLIMAHGDDRARTVRSQRATTSPDSSPSSRAPISC